MIWGGLLQSLFVLEHTCAFKKKSGKLPAENTEVPCTAVIRAVINMCGSEV